MDIAILFGIILIVLFVVAYLTKRRFGVLGLALAAGALLSDLWADKLTPLIADSGVVVERPPLLTLVAAGIVLLPAVVLFVSGPVYRKSNERLIGAFLFALLAVALLVEPLGSGLLLSGESKQVYDVIAENRVYIITGGLIIAVIDILFTRIPKRGGKH